MYKIIKKKTHFGWLIIYTQDLNESNFIAFKNLIDGIEKSSWMMLPSEWVKKVEFVPRLSLRGFVKLITTKIQWWLYCRK